MSELAVVFNCIREIFYGPKVEPRLGAIWTYQYFSLLCICEADDFSFPLAEVSPSHSVVEVNTTLILNCTLTAAGLLNWTSVDLSFRHDNKTLVNFTSTLSTDTIQVRLPVRDFYNHSVIECLATSQERREVIAQTTFTSGSELMLQPNY